MAVKVLVSPLFQTAVKAFTVLTGAAVEAFTVLATRRLPTGQLAGQAGRQLTPVTAVFTNYCTFMLISPKLGL